MLGILTIEVTKLKIKSIKYLFSGCFTSLFLIDGLFLSLQSKAPTVESSIVLTAAGKCWPPPPLIVVWPMQVKTIKFSPRIN